MHGVQQAFRQPHRRVDDDASLDLAKVLVVEVVVRHAMRVVHVRHVVRHEVPDLALVVPVHVPWVPDRQEGD